MTDLISTAEAVNAICDSAKQHGTTAVDTEFVWTRTYYPILGLIQMAVSEDEAWLIDPLELEDTSALAQVMTAGEVVKLLHDAPGDLAILNRLCGAPPAAIFDTRMAAGFCGMPATLSLVNLLEEMLGVELAKTESRTDWIQRPLSDAQLSYALDDVRHMPELYEKLLERLEEYGNKDWALEEMRAYEDPDGYLPSSPEKAYRDVKGMGRLFPDQLAVLKEVAAWRERAASDIDITRSRLLKDETMLDIARKKPTSQQALRSTRSMLRRTLKHNADEIIAAVEAGRSVPESDYPSLPSCPIDSKELKRRADAVLKVVRREAKQRGIDPVLVAPRRSVNALILRRVRGGDESHPLLNGWRRELLGDTLEELLSDLG